MAVSVLIGVPCRESAPSSAFYAHLQQLQPVEGMAFTQARTGVIPGARNRLCREALRVGAEWLWMLDDDQLFAPDALTRLLAHDTDVVAPLVLSRKPPFAPIAFRTAREDGAFDQLWLDGSMTGLIPVAAAGLGGLLIRTRVLRAIGDPYFAFQRSAQNPDDYAEDLPFYRALHALGIQPYLDLDTIFGHTITSIVWPLRQQGQWMTVLAEEQPFAAWPQPQSPLAIPVSR